MPNDTTLILGAVGLIALNMVSPFAHDVYRRIRGEEYATKADCKAHHEQKDAECTKRHAEMAKDCEACLSRTQTTICAIQHDAAKNRKLLLLIAFQLQIPRDELKDFL